MWSVVVLVGAIGCAIQAIRVKRLLSSALWLAGASAFVALLMYLLGASEVAVVELSVGAGLVTVLFVFAINIAGEEPMEVHSLIPRPVAWGLTGLSLVLLAWLGLPRLEISLPGPLVAGFASVLWEQRGLDVLLQVVLIFAGVLGVLGLLADSKTPSSAEQEAHS